MNYSFESNSSFSYISLLCSDIYICLIFVIIEIVLQISATIAMHYSFEGSLSFFYISLLCSHIYICVCVCGGGWRIWQSPAHFISRPRPTPRRKKCPRTNEGNLGCQDILLKTTLSSADQNHRRGRRHVAQGSPLEDPKGDSKSNGPAIGAW